MDYQSVRWHTVYIVHNKRNDIMYIGSTGLSLSQLEYNHRNFRNNKYKATGFRIALETYGQDWTFSVLHEGPCTKEDIEKVEGYEIRRNHPKYNFDLDPYNTSKKYGRIA